MTQELQRPAFSRESIEMLDAMGLGPVWLLRDSMDPLGAERGFAACSAAAVPGTETVCCARHGLNSRQPKREVSRRRLNPLARHRHPPLRRLRPRQLRSRRSA